MSISVAHLSVSFREKPVVHDVSFDVPRGGWTVLIGPNGAGKSSVLRAIAGLIEHGGEVNFESRQPADSTRRSRAQMLAYVPQRPTLPAAMTVGDYVHLGRTPYIPLFSFESPHDRSVVSSVLERLELGSFAHRKLSEISGGEAQRAVLGRALAQQTSYLLLDEPTTALDLGHQQSVLELVSELRREQGLTIVSSTHDLTLAGHFADDLVLLAHGQLQAAGTAREVMSEENIFEHFGASVEIIEKSDGTIIVIPVPRGASMTERRLRGDLIGPRTHENEDLRQL